MKSHLYILCCFVSMCPSGGAGEAATSGQPHPGSLWKCQNSQKWQLFSICKKSRHSFFVFRALCPHFWPTLFLNHISFLFPQGKFIRINFDVNGYIVGANIETCILGANVTNPCYWVTKETSILSSKATFVHRLIMCAVTFFMSTAATSEENKW